MYQVLIEFTDIDTLTALYCGIYFGVTLKFLWAWKVEYSFLGSISEPTQTKIIHPFIFYNRKSILNGNIILIRIAKYIRRKENPADDSEEPISFSY